MTNDRTVAKLEPSSCPACGALFTAATETGGSGRCIPEPGDLSVCHACGMFLVYDANGVERLLTSVEYKLLPQRLRLALLLSRAALVEEV